MYLAVFIIFTVLGCWILYLSQPQQTWLGQAISVKTGRLLYLLTQSLALTGLLQEWSVLCSFFSWLVVTMLCFSSLPFLSLFRKKIGS